MTIRVARGTRIMGHLKLYMLNNIFTRIAEINLDGDCNSCDYEGCINNKQ